MKCAIVLFALATSLIAAAPIEWRRGKLLDLAVSQTLLPSGRPAPRKLFTFTVDGGDKVYEGQEVARTAPRVEVNAPIGYAVSRNTLYVKDSDGKVHKLSLLKTTRKE